MIRRLPAKPDPQRAGASCAARRLRYGSLLAPGLAMLASALMPVARTCAESIPNPELAVPAPGGQPDDRAAAPRAGEAPLRIEAVARPGRIERAGQAVHLSLTIFNNADAALDSFTIEGANAPAMCAGSGGPAVFRLAPGGRERCTARRVVSQADIDGNGDGVMEIGFSARSDRLLGQVSVPVRLAVRPSLRLERSYSFIADGGTRGAGDRGDIVAHVYVVTNSGNVTIDDVRLGDRRSGSERPVPVARETLINDAPPHDDSTDAVPDDGKWSRLAPGDTVLFATTQTITQADMDRGAATAQNAHQPDGGTAAADGD